MKLVVHKLLGIDYSYEAENEAEERYLKLYCDLVMLNEEIKLDIIEPNSWYIFLYENRLFGRHEAKLSFCLFSCTLGLDFFRTKYITSFKQRYD